MKRGTAMMTTPATRPPRPSAPLRMTPGRWAALAIGVPVALAFIGWTGFSFVTGLGRASFPVNTSIPIQNGHLVASTGGGDITLRQDQARSNMARLAGTVQYSIIRPRLTINRGGLHLDCRLLTGNCGLNATLDVPLDTAVNLASEGGNMQVSGIDSDVTLESGGGDVTVSRVGGIANVSTDGGNVAASDLARTLKFSTSGGDVSGNGLSAPQVTTESGGGNVTLAFTKAPVNLNIHSDGGDITILLPHGSTHYAITGTPDGGEYPTPSVPTSSTSANTITVDSGGGNINIAES
jgi:Putative adhesin